MSTGIQMTSNDWGLVLKGAQLKEFQKGEIIVKVIIYIYFSLRNSIKGRRRTSKNLSNW